MQNNFKNMNNLAVLITCHNRKNKTIECLKKLYKQTDFINFKTEIFLVDDNSTDGTADIIKKNFTDVNLIKGDGNLFWGGGIYLAWEEAIKKKQFEYFLWLNDDTFLYPNALQMLFKCKELTKSDEFIAVGSTCDSIKKNWTYGGFKNLNKKISVFENKKIYPNDGFQFIDRFNGNIVLISNKAFIKVGKFDKSLNHYFGDMDYAIRASIKKIPIILSPNYLGICDVGKKKRSLKDLFYNKKIIKSIFIFCKKHGNEFWLYQFVRLVLKFR